MSVLLVISTLLYLTDLRLHQATTQAYLQVQVAQKLLVQSQAQTTKAKGEKLKFRSQIEPGIQLHLNCTKIRVFTLIEATVALVVTAMGLALLAGIGSNMQKQMVAKQEIDQFEWERFVSLLQNERQHFALVKKPGENVENIYLYSRKAKKDYIVHYESERDKVIMETASGGYMPLLYRVSSFRAIKQDKTIKITVQIDQRTYQTTFSLPLQKESGL